MHVEFRLDETTLRKVAETTRPRSATSRRSPLKMAGSRRPPAIRRLYLQLGVAGFAFGNIMLFSIPRYANGGPLEGDFQPLFDVLNILFALPVLLFSASLHYFRIALAGGAGHGSWRSRCHSRSGSRCSSAAAWSTSPPGAAKASWIRLPV